MSLYRVYDRGILFHRAFVEFGAGVTGALMLSQSVYWAGRSSRGDGWFYKSQQEWTEETGLTRYEQEGARKKLIEAGVLQERKIGVPCKLWYRPNMDIIHALVMKNSQYAENPQTSLLENPEQVGGKPADIHTEITTEKKHSVDHQDGRPTNEEIIKAYQEVCGGVFKGAELMTPKREANVKKLMKLSIRGKQPFREKGIEFWKAFFNDCLSNQHWRGGNDRGWVADFEFITRPENVAKVLGV